MLRLIAAPEQILRLMLNEEVISGRFDQGATQHVDEGIVPGVIRALDVQ
jgi:hypothetical protein